MRDALKRAGIRIEKDEVKGMEDGNTNRKNEIKGMEDEYKDRKNKG